MTSLDRKLRTGPVLLCLLWMAWLGLGCATAGAPDSAADPLAEFGQMVIDGPTLDIGPNSASFTATTRENTVCAVAFGTTTEYGQIATDFDMDAGGHKEHNPVLFGLQPDTLYHYRFGGIGPDGTVFRSEDFTFRTPSADAGASPARLGENLAALDRGARVVGTSGNFGGGDNASTWGANQAFDGDPDTQWASSGDGDDAWIEVELPTETHVTSLGFWTRTMGSSAQIFSFQVVTDRGEVAGPFELDDASSLQLFDADLMAKRLRFEAVDTSGGNTGAVEIQVFGTPLP